MGSRPVHLPDTMPTQAEHTHHIKLRSTQLEMRPGLPSQAADDYDDKLQAAQQQLERLQQQREELERKKLEIEELDARKRALIASQTEVAERLSNSITQIDRELFGMRQELQDLEECRVCFAAHLDKIGKMNPDSWSRDNLRANLDRANSMIEHAEDEYKQAVSHFDGMRSGAIFGRPRKSRTSHSDAQFLVNLTNGFAFNLPLVLLGAAALVVWMMK